MATYARPGEQRTFTLRDLSVAGVAVTATTVGATVTIGLYTVAGVQAIAPVSATASGDDWSATLTMPVLAGTYVVTAVATVDYQASTFSEEVSVRAVPPPGSATLGSLRRRIAGDLGDLTILTATVASIGRNTFRDDQNLTEEPGAYKGRDVMLTGGTTANLAVQRRVESSSRDSRTLTLDRALPSLVAVGDTAEMVNKRGIGFRFVDYHRAINAAINDMADDAPTPVTITSSAFDRATGAVVLPEDFAWVSDVRYLDTAGQWRQVSRTNRLTGNGWQVDRAAGTIHVGGPWGYSIHGLTLEITGAKREGPLDHDEDVTGIDAEWIVARSCYLLMVAGLHGESPGAGSRERSASLYLQTSERVRARATRRMPVNMTRVR